VINPEKEYMSHSNFPLKHGENTYIDKTASFFGKVEIGDGCYIGAQVIIGQPSNYEISEAQKSTNTKIKRLKKTIIGDNVLIQPNVIISNDVIIENNVQIDPYVTIGAHSRIGHDTKIVYHSQIYENVKIGNNCIIGGFLCDCSKVGNDVSMMGILLHKFKDAKWDDEEDLSNKSPIIEDHAVVGYNSLVIGHVPIRKNTYVAAGAIVTKKNIPGNCVVTSVNKFKSRDEWSGKLKEGKFFRTCDKS
jgi:acetyltransferase-like isoleucine patch superfamily enzyme